jgi:hypothetical protein
MKKASQREKEFRDFCKIYPRYIENARVFLRPDERIDYYEAMFDALLYDKWPSAEARANMSVGAALMVEQFEWGWRTSVRLGKVGKEGGRQTQERRRQAEQGIDIDTGGEITEDAPTQSQAEPEPTVATPSPSPTPTSPAPAEKRPTYFNAKLGCECYVDNDEPTDNFPF